MLFASAADKGLRVVEVSAAEVPNLMDVARGCGRYPRLRFLIVADHVDLPFKGQVATDLMTGLAGNTQA